MKPDPRATTKVPPASACSKKLRAQELPTQAFQDIRTTQGSLDSFETILTQPERVVTPFGNAVNRSMSTSWRGRSLEAQQYRDAVRDYLQSLTSEVQLIEKSDVTLSGRSATIPVTVQNKLVQGVDRLVLQLYLGQPPTQVQRRRDHGQTAGQHRGRAQPVRGSHGDQRQRPGPADRPADHRRRPPYGEAVTFTVTVCRGDAHRSVVIAWRCTLVLGGHQDVPTASAPWQATRRTATWTNPSSRVTRLRTPDRKAGPRRERVRKWTVERCRRGRSAGDDEVGVSMNAPYDGDRGQGAGGAASPGAGLRFLRARARTAPCRPTRTSSTPTTTTPTGRRTYRPIPCGRGALRPRRPSAAAARHLPGAGAPLPATAPRPVRPGPAHLGPDPAPRACGAPPGTCRTGTARRPRSSSASTTSLTRALGRPAGSTGRLDRPPASGRPGRQARSAGRLHGSSAPCSAAPRRLQSLDAVEENDLVYVVHEWLPDATELTAVLAAGPMEAHDAYQLVSQLSQAMAAAHREGLSHLRLTPGAVLRSSTGQYRILGLRPRRPAGIPAEHPLRTDTDAIGALPARSPDPPPALRGRCPRARRAAQGPGGSSPPTRSGPASTAASPRPRCGRSPTTVPPPPRQEPPCTTPDELAKAVAAMPRILPPEPTFTAPPAYQRTTYQQGTYGRPSSHPSPAAQPVMAAPPAPLRSRTGRVLKWTVPAAPHHRPGPRRRLLRRDSAGPPARPPTPAHRAGPPRRRHGDEPLRPPTPRALAAATAVTRRPESCTDRSAPADG
ncbi:hypothetical protein SBADM41S_03644 [Streptomyces badius]